MKNWNIPEVEELSLTLTAGKPGNTGNTGENNPNYKTKKQHYEQGYSTNFVLAPETESDYGYEGGNDYTGLTDGPS